MKVVGSRHYRPHRGDYWKKPSIVLLGSSGIGKTYALRKAFSIDFTYGYKAVCLGSTPTRFLNDYAYIPELRNTRNNWVGVYDGFVDFLRDNETVVVTDINTTAPFAKKVVEAWSKPEYFVLTATDDEIHERIMSRPSAPNASLSKDEVIAKTIKQRDKDIKLGHPVVTQDEFIAILNNGIVVDKVSA